jgi:hypothetical protein
LLARSENTVVIVDLGHRRDHGDEGHSAGTTSELEVVVIPLRAAHGQLDWFDVCP